MDEHRILVVANQTACGRELLDMVREHMSGRASTVTLVVPATHPSDLLTWTDHSSRLAAEHRLAEAIEHFGAEGIVVDGVVGDASPVLAVGDLLLERSFDEIILSTFPPGMSRWLKMDLPHRLEKHGLPVTTVVGDRAPVTARAPDQ